MDHITGVATKYIEEHLGENPVQWSDVSDHLKARGYTAEATAAVTRAVLDLERSEVMFFALEGMRRPRPGDAAPAPLDEVAAAVMSLPWPCTRNDRPGGSRSIWEAFEELGGRYRHSDVYEAMHAHLKGNELKSSRVYWQRTDLPSRFDSAGRFALRAAAVASEPANSPARRKLEADLVTAFVATLPHRYVREHPVGGLRADVYEPTVRRIVEAKAGADVVMVAHAWAQAAAYRHVMNTSFAGDKDPCDAIALLLPEEPVGAARSFLQRLGADCYEVEIIFPVGDSFETFRFC